MIYELKLFNLLSEKVIYKQSSIPDCYSNYLKKKV